MEQQYIGVFDSGVGGISVLKRLLEVLPNEKYLYFGDSINAPYGVRTEEEVRQLSLAAMDRMVKRGIKAFVIACNTATSAAQAALQEAHPDVDMYLAACDEKLNDHAYIVPGLGDAGDRIFGTK